MPAQLLPVVFSVNLRTPTSEFTDFFPGCGMRRNPKFLGFRETELPPPSEARRVLGERLGVSAGPPWVGPGPLEGMSARGRISLRPARRSRNPYADSVNRDRGRQVESQSTAGEHETIAAVGENESGRERRTHVGRLERSRMLLQSE